MKVNKTPIAGLLVIEPAVFGDERGYFYESFNEKRFTDALVQDGQSIVQFVQDNQSCSKTGVLRGLHYQLPPFAQGKLVRVVQGLAWDVAVDIRRSSATFGQWYGLELSERNQKQFWIPPGFAHGFIAMEEGTQFLYKTTDYYNKDSERSIVWNDTQLNIAWPSVQELCINGKDANATEFKRADLFE